MFKRANYSFFAIGCCFFMVNLLPGIAMASGKTPKCDIRQLELTPIQKAKIRLIRMQYKNELEKEFNQAWNTPNTRNYSRKLAQILTQTDFNENQAKRYVSDKYASRIQLEINELKVQHAFLQVLNPQQKQDWMRNCLR